MIQVTVFSGHEGMLRCDRLVYLTLFGGCELVRPTLARQLLARRRAGRDPMERPRRPFFFTMFGGTAIKAPTLAQEFLDLREIIGSGVLRAQELDGLLAELDQSDGALGSFTLFGGFDECELPSENAEIDSLGIQRHLGNLSEEACRVLQLGIGQRDSERRAAVRRAVLVDA